MRARRASEQTSAVVLRLALFFLASDFFVAMMRLLKRGELIAGNADVPSAIERIARICQSLHSFARRRRGAALSLQVLLHLIS